MATITKIIHPSGGHWVGDGFPVRSLFGYHDDPQAISPFLLFDFAGPYQFTPATAPRGVGQHPHRGFETVTIVYDGEVSHRDSTGGGGTIGTGDVQWMTAAGGIIHEEFHSDAFTRSGGRFQMVQLWVDLPRAVKMSAPGYQAIAAADIPAATLGEGASARVIAGAIGGVSGPARTFSPVNLWDVTIAAGASARIDLPAGHNAMIAVLRGAIAFADGRTASQADLVRFDRAGGPVTVAASDGALILVLTGEPLNQPVVGHGPFVMTSREDIIQAVDDFNSGRFGQVAA